MHDRNWHPDSLITRAGTALSRRAALLPLAGGAIAALSHPRPAHAGKAKKRVKKTCRRQIGQCEESVAAICAQGFAGASEETCNELMLQCCPFFAGCKAEAAIGCFYDVSVLLRDV